VEVSVCQADRDVGGVGVRVMYVRMLCVNVWTQLWIPDIEWKEYRLPPLAPRLPPSITVVCLFTLHGAMRIGNLPAAEDQIRRTPPRCTSDLHSLSTY